VRQNKLAVQQELLDRRPEKRFCAFLDILGFKEILQKIENEPRSQVVERLVSALKFLSDETRDPAYGADLPIYEPTEDGLIQRELGDPRLTYVSDCIIISTDHTADGFKALCRKVSKLWLDLAWDGFFCRGGISHGTLFHHSDIVFGTAYLKALEMEKTAEMPRVVIDADVVDFLGGFPATFPLCPPTCHQGPDQRIYLRYFPYHFFPPYAFSWSDYLHRVRGHICDGIEKHQGRVQAKYQFLRDEFNFCVTHFRNQLDPSLRINP
jgi:hypothetical protein